MLRCGHVNFKTTCHTVVLDTLRNVCCIFSIYDNLTEYNTPDMCFDLDTSDYNIKLYSLRPSVYISACFHKFPNDVL